MDDHRNARAATDSERRRFVAVLALFLLWVASLGVMAAFSGRRPVPNPAAISEP